MFTAKLGNSLMIGFETSHEPDEGEVIMGLPLQFPGAAHPVRIAIDQKFEHG